MRWIDWNTNRVQPSQFSDALLISFCFTVFAEEWTVEDLLHKEDITDKVPPQRLQQLGINPTLPFLTLQFFLILLAAASHAKYSFIQHLYLPFTLQVSRKSWEIFCATPTWDTYYGPLTAQTTKTVRCRLPCRSLCLLNFQISVWKL